MLSTVCLLVFLLGVVSVSAQPINVPLGNQNGLTVMLSPTSIIVSRQLSTPSMPQTTGEITLSLASIRQLDDKMNQESYSSNIVYGPVRNTNLALSVQTECKFIPYSYSNANTEDGSIVMCGFLNSGTIFYGAESITVTQGQLLVLMGSIVRWTATGQYLEVKVSISVIRGRKMSVTSMGSPVVLGLGTTDSYAMLSTRVLTNTSSTFNTMPTGYPKLTQSNPVDNEASIIAMLPRSSVGTEIFAWGIVIEPGYQQPSSSSQAPGSSLACVVALACLAGCFNRRL